jgi:hypothetical protein
MATIADREQLVPLAGAADLFPPGTKLYYASLMRWASSGVGGVVLGTRRVGFRVYTTRSAVEQFLAACQRERKADPSAEAPLID